MSEKKKNDLTQIKVSERTNIASLKFIPGRYYNVNLATHKALGKLAIPPFKK